MIFFPTGASRLVYPYILFETVFSVIKTVTLANIKSLMFDFGSIFYEALNVISCEIFSKRVCSSVAREYEIFSWGIRWIWEWDREIALKFRFKNCFIIISQRNHHGKKMDLSFHRQSVFESYNYFFSIWASASLAKGQLSRANFRTYA